MEKQEKKEISVARKFNNLIAPIQDSNNGSLRMFAAEIKTFGYTSHEKKGNHDIYYNIIKKYDENYQPERLFQALSFSKEGNRFIISLDKYNIGFGGQKTLRSKQVLTAVKEKEGYYCSYDISTYRKNVGTAKIVTKTERTLTFPIDKDKKVGEVNLRLTKFETDKNGRVL